MSEAECPSYSTFLRMRPKEVKMMPQSGDYSQCPECLVAKQVCIARNHRISMCTTSASFLCIQGIRYALVESCITLTLPVTDAMYDQFCKFAGRYQCGYVAPE
eukprot:gene11727-3473_t